MSILAIDEQTGTIFEGEIRNVPGFPGYGASQDGKVWSRRNNNGRLRPYWLEVPGSVNPDGYIRVALRSNNAPKTMLAHRVVWLTWCGAIPEDREINHVDGNKRNNGLDNLELVTDSENTLHAYRLGLARARRGSENHAAKLSECVVRIAAHLRRSGKTYREIGEALRVKPLTIRRALVDKNKWSHVDVGPLPKLNLRARGERHGMSKITEAQAIEIIRLKACGKHISEVANSLGVSRKIVGRVMRGESWSHLRRP